jgi:hypothetical protein
MSVWGMWALKIRLEQLDGPWGGIEQAGEWVCRGRRVGLSRPALSPPPQSSVTASTLGWPPRSAAAAVRARTTRRLAVADSGAFKVPGSTGDSAQRQAARPESEQHYKGSHGGTERRADLN